MGAARSTLWGALALALVALAAYHNSFSGPFIFDDETSILTENASIREIGRITEVLSPVATAGVGGRPLVNLSLAINYALGGDRVWGYHAVNFLVHLGAGLALWGVVRRTLRRPRLVGRFGTAAEWLALAIAGCWLVHPLQTEAVTYISQRTEALMGLCYFLALYGFIRCAEATRPLGWQIGSVVACVLGALSKEVIVTAPIMVLLFDRTFVAGSFRAAWRQRWRYYLALGSAWLVLALLMLDVQRRGVGYGLSVTWWQYAFTSCRTLVHYLWLAVWPHPLVFDYGVATIRSAAIAAPYAALLIGLVVAVLLALRRWPALGFLGAWFFVTLAPTTSVVPVAFQPMAEHRMYLALAAVVAAIVCCAHASLGRRSLLVTLALVIGGGLLTVRRNADYRTDLAIWTDTVTKAPQNARARAALATALANLGRLEEAATQFKASLQLDQPYIVETRRSYAWVLLRLHRHAEAVAQREAIVRLMPADAQSRRELAHALFVAGRRDDSIDQAQTAAQLSSNDPVEHFELGSLFYQLGQPLEAMAQFRETLRLQPGNAAASSNLGNALLASGRAAEAVAQLEAAVALTPNDAFVRCNLGRALITAGRLPEAIGQYRRALQLDPSLGGAHHQLARLLEETGAADEALKHYAEALRLEPNDPDTHSNYGSLLAARGRVPEAIQHFEAALRLKPDHAPARRSLVRIQNQ